MADHDQQSAIGHRPLVIRHSSSAIPHRSSVIDHRSSVIRHLSFDIKFFHWELEFPDVFTPHRTGFDGLIGNPPWDVMKPNSQEFFTEFDPLYRTYDKQAAVRKQKELLQAVSGVTDFLPEIMRLRTGRGLPMIFARSDWVHPRSSNSSRMNSPGGNTSAGFRSFIGQW